MEFVKGKPKGTNPANMGNPIDICAVNGSKRQSILLQENLIYFIIITIHPLVHVCS